MLGEAIQESWEPQVQEQWRENRRRITEAILAEYGPLHGEVKIRNFVDFGRIPFSVFAFHNRFVEQIRASFVGGGYYPALTGACALGERILNHLIILLRDDFRATPQYKRVHAKNSFDNWDLAIDTLNAWNVLLPEVVTAFRELRVIRGRAIHFRPELDTTDRALALEAGALSPPDRRWTIRSRRPEAVDHDQYSGRTVHHQGSGIASVHQTRVPSQLPSGWTQAQARIRG
jgi:hypothetical protein